MRTEQEIIAKLAQLKELSKCEFLNVRKMAASEVQALVWVLKYCEECGQKPQHEDWDTLCQDCGIKYAHEDMGMVYDSNTGGYEKQ